MLVSACTFSLPASKTAAPSLPHPLPNTASRPYWIYYWYLLVDIGLLLHGSAGHQWFNLRAIAPLGDVHLAIQLGTEELDDRP